MNMSCFAGVFRPKLTPSSSNVTNSFAGNLATKPQAKASDDICHLTWLMEIALTRKPYVEAAFLEAPFFTERVMRGQLRTSSKRWIGQELSDLPSKSPNFRF